MNKDTREAVTELRASVLAASILIRQRFAGLYAAIPLVGVDARIEFDRRDLSLVRGKGAPEKIDQMPGMLLPLVAEPIPTMVEQLEKSEVTLQRSAEAASERLDALCKEWRDGPKARRIAELEQQLAAKRACTCDAHSTEWFVLKQQLADATKKTAALEQQTETLKQDNAALEASDSALQMRVAELTRELAEARAAGPKFKVGDRVVTGESHCPAAVVRALYMYGLQLEHGGYGGLCAEDSLTLVGDKPAEPEWHPCTLGVCRG